MPHKTLMYQKVHLMNSLNKTELMSNTEINDAQNDAHEIKNPINIEFTGLKVA